jgi:predicted SAM-dependent methyltransferase
MNNFKLFLISETKPKYKLTKSLVGNAPAILDIGIANNSYKEAKSIYPGCNYVGIDVVPVDFKMEPGDDFHLADLQQVSVIDLLGDKRFDLVIANHVLEHLSNGDEVYRNLCKILKPNGVLYVEYPSVRTVFKKKTSRSYHFHDDPTHCRVYQVEELVNIAFKENCNVISCGPISTPLKSLMSIPRAIFNMILGRPYGSYLLFPTGKIDHVLACRNITR